MSWSYSGDPSASPKDEVRFLIQDTDSESPLISDEEILYLLSTQHSPLSAAIEAADILAARFARAGDVELGDFSVNASEFSAKYRVLARDLKRRKAKKGIPYAGGIKVTDKSSQEANENLVEPYFERRQFDHPGTTGDRRDLNGEP